MLAHNSPHIRIHRRGIALITVAIVILLLSGCSGAQQPKVYHVVFCQVQTLLARSPKASRLR